jgi:hypothetical protein
MIFKNIEIGEVPKLAIPLPFEEADIKILKRISLVTGKADGIPYGFMCKRCGAEWEFNEHRCHEAYCIYFGRGGLTNLTYAV